VKSALVDLWIRSRPDDCRVTQETTFRLSEDTYLEPDVVIYPRANGLRGLTGANVLLVVEIADSSLHYDTGRKAALYASFGIRELWVIGGGRLSQHAGLWPRRAARPRRRAGRVRGEARRAGAELRRRSSFRLTPAS
jgi:Uma2 family endonuclease